METNEDVRRDGIVVGRHKMEKRQFADHLRKNQTLTEARLWNCLRAGRLGGLHFRRQQIIDGFIVDFFCFSAGLIVEIDGSIHEARCQEDEDRVNALRKRNLKILRFSNQQVANELPKVLHQINTAAQTDDKQGE